jgi:hypothetical protein
MSKFVVVSKAPAQLGKGEVVITPPSFVELITAAARRGGSKRDQTGVNQLREILGGVQEKYQCDLNIFKIPLSQYEGLTFNSEEELSDIVTTLLNKERPDAFERILEYNIKTRPYGTKLVYYVGRLQDTGPFFKHGLDMLEEKDVDEYLGRKPKKVVGKPALTKEQAEEMNN